MKKNIIINIIIIGPTGIGKSGYADALAQNENAEIINADIGSLYKPLTIGTAKPDIKNSTVRHHLFDIFDEPINYTAADFYKKVSEITKDINSRGKKAIIVGGSHFYIYSLLFPPQDIPASSFQGGSWQELFKIDEKRALEINPNDQYRIDRALGIYYKTGLKPSSLKPKYMPLWPYELIALGRNRQEMQERIHLRLDEMLKEGWYEEARSLKGSKWDSFIRQKGLIGYAELMDTSKEDYLSNVEQIKKDIYIQTRQYAKRQLTFIKGLIKKIVKKETGGESKVRLINLTKPTCSKYNFSKN